MTHYFKRRAVLRLIRSKGFKGQAAVLIWLQAGLEITVQQCFREFGTTELRRMVSRLRKMGYNIVGYSREGEKFKRYYISKIW